MRYKRKRIFIGLILPAIASVLICGAFYFKNAHQEFLQEIADYKGDDSEQMKGIIIRKDNWQEYFSLEIKEDVYYYKLKEEFQDEIATERASFVNITFSEGLYLTWSSASGKDFEAVLEIDSGENVQQDKLKVEKITGELYLIR